MFFRKIGRKRELPVIFPVIQDETMNQTVQEWNCICADLFGSHGHWLCGIPNEGSKEEEEINTQEREKQFFLCEKS